MGIVRDILSAARVAVSRHYVTVKLFSSPRMGHEMISHYNVAFTKLLFKRLMIFHMYTNGLGVTLQ